MQAARTWAQLSLVVSGTTPQSRPEHTSDARVLVGIDISKARHEMLIAVPGKARHRRMTVLNTAADYRRLSFPQAVRFHRSCHGDLFRAFPEAFPSLRSHRDGHARLRLALWLAPLAAVLKPANSFPDRFERYIAQDRHNPDRRRKAPVSAG